MDRFKVPIGIGVSALISTFGVTAVPTSAAESAEGPILQAEQICRAHNEKLPTLGPRGKALLVPPAEWTPAEERQKGRFLRRTGRILGKTANELSGIEFPDEYQDQYAEWVGFVRRAAVLYEEAGAALNAGHKKEALQLPNRLKLPPRLLHFEEAVGFRYCRFEPAKLA